jgi:FSR family fosmidomycin resistance protein-like MFS transporter
MAPADVFGRQPPRNEVDGLCRPRFPADTSMNNSNQSISRQWAILLALTAGHFVVDCFPGTMHTLLPEVQRVFHFNLSSGATLLMYFLLAANGVQVVMGHLRPNKTRPLFLYLGFACSLFLCCLILLPHQQSSFWPLVGMLFICGLGVGATHPEFLRSVHTLGKISPAVGTSVFMAGGVGGFAFGGWVATGLVQKWGFSMLWYFCAISIVMALVLFLLRVRLAQESAQPEPIPDRPGHAVPFWPLYITTVVAGSASSVLVWAIPQALNKAGFELTFGGFSVMLFSLAGGLGGMLVSRRAARKGEMKTCIWMLAAGVPFGFLYPVLIAHRWSSALVAVTGLLCYGAYPLMVSMARQSRGGNLGRRMGLIVGGTWLIAGFMPRLMAPVAQKISLQFVLFLAPVGYLVAAGMCWYLWTKMKRVNNDDAI